MTKACVILNWHQGRQTWWVLPRARRLKEYVLPWAMCCRRHVRHDASPQLLSSFHWGIAASDDAFGCQKFRSRQKQWRASAEDSWLETIGVTHPLWKISGYATVNNTAAMLLTLLICCSVSMTEQTVPFIHRHCLVKHYNVLMWQWKFLEGLSKTVWTLDDYREKTVKVTFPDAEAILACLEPRTGIWWQGVRVFLVSVLFLCVIFI